MSSATLLFGSLLGIWIFVGAILIWAKRKAPRRANHVADPNAGRSGHNFVSGDSGGH